MGERSRIPNENALFEGAALGVLLGSGLGGVSESFPVRSTVRFDEIEGLSAASVAGHKGELKLCLVSNRPCVFICGRKHFYEGHADEMRILMSYLHDTGLRQLVLTSAAGSLLKSVVPGELVLITDVLDTQFRSPRPVETEQRGREETLPGPQADRVGRPWFRERPSFPRQPAIDGAMSRGLWKAASDVRLGIGRGAAAACAGPVYETPAEIRALQETGASVVTMSGALDIEAANAAGIQVAMVAVVTNWAAGISSAHLHHEDVLNVARSASARLRQLIVRFIETR